MQYCNIAIHEYTYVYHAGTLLLCTPNGSACSRTLDVLIDGVQNLDGFRILIKLDGGSRFPAKRLGVGRIAMLCSTARTSGC